MKSNRKRQGPWNKTDIHQNKKIPIDRPYSQTQGPVTAKERFFKHSLKRKNSQTYTSLNFSDARYFLYPLIFLILS